MDRILEYYDYIRRLAETRVSDADDLVSETFLAAYSFLSRGGVIEHPKTWLSNTFFHKLNDSLRRKYRQPTIVSLDDEPVDDPETADTDKIRREIDYLSRLTREVIIDYYYNGSDVGTIAARLNIPVGTVKSRLFAGREKIRKGFDTMKETKHALAGRLNTWYSGRAGRTEPNALIVDDLIVQNLLALAYDKPLTLPELADAIGIPTVYIEPIVKKLVDAELMTESNGKVATDFIIYRPEDFEGRFEAEQQFTTACFERFWSVIAEGIDGLDKLRSRFGERQKNSLERYFALTVLQNFEMVSIPKRPERRDGGAWDVCGSYLPAGYVMSDKERREDEYLIWGGHRRSNEEDELGGMELCEFDTTLWDNPHRYNVVGADLYFDGGMLRFLRCVAEGLPLGKDIPGAIIEKIPDIIKKTGLLVRDGNELRLGIPALSAEECGFLRKNISACGEKLNEALGGEYHEFLRGQMIPAPKRLSGISEVYRYYPAARHIVMLVIREAYERGLHLKGVNWCCPPAVFVTRRTDSRNVHKIGLDI